MLSILCGGIKCSVFWYLFVCTVYNQDSLQDPEMHENTTFSAVNGLDVNVYSACFLTGGTLFYAPQKKYKQTVNHIMAKQYILAL